MKIKLLSLVLSMPLFLAHASNIPIVLDIQSECVLHDSAPFKEAHEINLFKVIIVNESLLPQNGNIKDLYIWADGKSYPIHNYEEQVHPKQLAVGQRRHDQLYGDELRRISKSGFVKLWIKYEPEINKQQITDETSQYYTTTKTTVEKEEFTPVVLDRSKIDEVLSQCQEGIDTSKQRQFVFEILIGVGGVIAIGVLLVFLRKIRRKFKKEES